MNLVLDEAEEVSLKRKSRKPLGSIERLGLDAVTPFCAFSVAHAVQRPMHTQGTVMISLAAGRILLKGDNITLMQTT